MKDLIAYCGLDCEKCDARIATLNDDNELREKTAKLWSELNGAEITAEMINCVGCRVDGVKTPFCNSMCPIRKCAAGKKLATCGNCSKMDKCETLGTVTSNNVQALENLNNEIQTTIEKFKEVRDMFREMFRDFDNKDEAVDFLANKTKISKEECSAAYDIVMKMGDELLNNLDKVHTTEMGTSRIKRNLSLDTDDVVEWCKDKIKSADANITRKGKNWYVSVENCMITVNAYSFTIITAHKIC